MYICCYSWPTCWANLAEIFVWTQVGGREVLLAKKFEIFYFQILFNFFPQATPGHSASIYIYKHMLALAGQTAWLTFFRPK